MSAVDPGRAVMYVGTALTMDARGSVAGAVAVRGDRIVGVGTPQDVRAVVGPDADVVPLGNRCLLPGFVEAHGHPMVSALLLGPDVVDIRPVVMPTGRDVLDALREAVDTRPDGVLLNGWDPLLQEGLPIPTSRWLESVAADTPLVVLHNSGHSAYFNRAAAALAGIDDSTPDPTGASFTREAGRLTGTAQETGAVLAVVNPLLAAAQARYPRLLAAELGRLNAVGITTVSEMGWDRALAPVLDAARAAGGLTARLRLYEMSSPAGTTDARPGDGDDLVRQVGIKTWADGSPWVGSIAATFPYLDTPATRGLGLPPGHRAMLNYSRDQLDTIAEAYFPAGWQLACHAHGDLAVDTVLDCWTDLLARHPRADHRLRLEHAGAMTPDQFARAADLGVTVSLFPAHVEFWGDVLVDGLFGETRGAPWCDAAGALRAGLRVSFHNDGTVTPPDPLRNIMTAVTRRSRSGRVHGPLGVTVEQGLRAQTIDAAWQLHSDDLIGSLEVGKAADLVVLATDPRTVPPTGLPDVAVLATVLGGRQVFGDALI